MLYNFRTLFENCLISLKTYKSIFGDALAVSEVIVSIALFLCVFFVYYSQHNSKIKANLIFSIFLFAFFLVLTLIVDHTDWIPTNVLCLVMWPFVADFTLERISSYNPYVEILKEQLEQIDEDLANPNINPQILTTRMISNLRNKRMILRELVITLKHINSHK